MASRSRGARTKGRTRRDAHGSRPRRRPAVPYPALTPHISCDALRRRSMPRSPEPLATVASCDPAPLRTNPFVPANSNRGVAGSSPPPLRQARIPHGTPGLSRVRGHAGSGQDRDGFADSSEAAAPARPGHRRGRPPRVRCGCSRRCRPGLAPPVSRYVLRSVIGLREPSPATSDEAGEDGSGVEWVKSSPRGGRY
jgi:hypothetical protein